MVESTAPALEFTLTDPVTGQPVPEGTVLAPGSSYGVEVVLVGGGPPGSPPIQLPAKSRLRFSGQGMGLDAATGLVKADPLPPHQPGWTYTLNVESLDFDGVRQIRIYPADLALLYGPEPGDVAEMKLAVKRAAEGMFLPGEKARVSLWIKDAQGREYNSDQPEVRPVLTPRVRVLGEGVRFAPEDWSLALTREAFKPSEHTHTVTLEYGGPTGKRVAQRLALDLARVFGPEPKDVAKLEVHLQGLNANDTADPGKPLGIQVSVLDAKGRRYSTGKDEAFPLPWSRLRLETVNMEFRADEPLLKPEPDLVKMAGKTYRVTVSYEGVKALTTTYILRPELYAWYRNRMFKEPELVASGALGIPGAGGAPGAPGRAGRAGEGAGARPVDATAGEAGAPGRSGNPGARGPDIKVAATWVRTFDSLMDLIFVSVETQGKRSYFFRNVKDPPLKIVSVGGNGGDGASGGAGGAGGSGARGGSGGDGGAGGNGGSGGLGGDGGNVQLYLTRPDLQRHFALESRPGSGGRQGQPGDGGPGGRAGDPAPGGARGLTGRQGQQGLESQAGASGRTGPVAVMTGGPAADLNNNPPQEYRRNLFFVNVKVSAEQRVLAGTAPVAQPATPPARR